MTDHRITQWRFEPAHVAATRTQLTQIRDALQRVRGQSATAMQAIRGQINELWKSRAKGGDLKSLLTPLQQSRPLSNAMPRLKTAWLPPVKARVEIRRIVGPLPKLPLPALKPPAALQALGATITNSFAELARLREKLKGPAAPLQAVNGAQMFKQELRTVAPPLQLERASQMVNAVTNQQHARTMEAMLKNNQLVTQLLAHLKDNRTPRSASTWEAS